MLVTTPCPSGKRSKQDAAPDAQSAIDNGGNISTQSPVGPKKRSGVVMVQHTRTDDAARHRRQA